MIPNFFSNANCAIEESPNFGIDWKTNPLAKRITEVYARMVNELYWIKFKFLPEKLTAEMNIVNDLGFDSLDFMSFVMYLEEEFGFDLEAIPDREIDKLLYLGNIYQLMEKIEPRCR